MAHLRKTALGKATHPACTRSGARSDECLLLPGDLWYSIGNRWSYRVPWSHHACCTWGADPPEHRRIASSCRGWVAPDGCALRRAAMLIALVIITPIGFSGALPAMTRPLLLLAGIGVGICSSVIPYVSDQLAMARLPRATFALLLSLLPASATVIGIVVLRQIPAPVEIAGILLVAAGVALHRESEAGPRKRT